MTRFGEILAVCVGASLGALLRWGLAMAFNALFPAIPPGTLFANLLGAYLAGICAGFFSLFPEISPYWRLFVITGFLGALTTFSTFTTEMGNLFAQNKPFTAFCGICLHVGGSLILFFIGLGTFQILRILYARIS